MYYCFDMESQIKRILNKPIFKDKFDSSDIYLEDVNDGHIYNSLLQSEQGNLIKQGKAFTLTINTDGISVCEKSNLDIRPVYLVINEIKSEHRFSIENVIIAGL